MGTAGQDNQPSGGLLGRSVDVAFALLAAGWLLYVLRITRDAYFWADDPNLIHLGGTWRGLIEPYNGHMSLAILSIYRGSSELFGLSFRPIMLIGALCLLAVPVSYFATTRRTLGAPLAAILCVPLLWYDGIPLRPALLNHYLALIGGIVAAAALNRGRRADGLLFAAVALALVSSGDGLVILGACLLHNAIVRPPWRRWLAVLAPAAIWFSWWALIADFASAPAGAPLSLAETMRVVRDLCLAPFYAAGSGHWPIAWLLLAAFLIQGAFQLRRGLADGANFLAWTGAMVMWPLALVHSRGSLADAQIFRYAYLSMGFVLLAVVPRRPIQWPASVGATSRRWQATAAALVLVFGGLTALAVRGTMQDEAQTQAEKGRRAKGTMLVLDLGDTVIPDQTLIRFGIFGPYVTAGQMRTMAARYGSPFEATAATIDQDLVDRGIVTTQVTGPLTHAMCKPISQPLAKPGDPTLGLGDPPRGVAEPVVQPSSIRLWSTEPFSVDVRRFGEAWIRAANVPGGHTLTLGLPALSTKTPWEIRADGACEIIAAP